jgi:hypothetical protein
MTAIFNICLKKGFTPNQWRDNIVVMIYKKGEASDSENYRGIRLINTLAVVFI